MKYRTMYDITESWTETTWGNDECASYTFGNLKLFVDPEYEEYMDPEIHMYSLHRIDEHGECEYPRLYACDSEDEMVDQINAHLKA